MSSARHWSVFFSSEVAARGEMYYFQDAVDEFEVLVDDQEGILLEATVLGSELYDTSVAINGGSPRGEKLYCNWVSAECDCPARNPCKHAAALLYLFEVELIEDFFKGNLGNDNTDNTDSKSRALSDTGLPEFFDTIAEGQSDRERRPVDAWLRNFSQKSITLGNEQIRWTLHCQTGAEYAQLGAFISKPLKAGGWSRGRRVQDMRTLGYQPPSCAQEADILAASLLINIADRGSHICRGGNPDTWMLLHKNAHEVMRILIATERLSLENPSGPVLREGPMHDLELSWIQEGEKWQLVCGVANLNNAIVLPFSVPWYVDLMTGLMGPLQSTMPARMLEHVHAMPPMNEADVGLILSELRQAGSELAPPADWQQAERMPPTAIALIAKGYLEYVDYRWGSQNTSWECASEFLVPVVRYGEHVLPVHDAALETYVDGECIRRDGVFEKKMILMLEKMKLMERRHLQVDLTPKLPLPAYLSYVTHHASLNTRSPKQPAPLIDDSWQLPINLAAQLAAAGWELQGVDMPEQLIIGPEAIDAVFEEDGDWFQLDLGVMIDGERIDLIPALESLIADGDWEKIETVESLCSSGDAENILVPLPGGRILSAPRAPLQRIVHHLFELLGRGKKDDGLRLSIHDTDLLDDLDGIGARLQSHEALLKSAGKLRALAQGELPAVKVPKTFVGELRPYQEEGVSWMHALREVKLGGLLADDMGLGKTVMTIAYCALEKSKKRLQKGALIIAPRSMLGVWQKEFQRFAPKMKICSYHGEKRNIDDIAKYDVVCTTYAIATRDVKKLGACSFDIIICDEAQVLKNPQTKATKAINTLQSDWRLALTGTPMENHLGELWSLMRWLNAGLLGSQKHFSTLFRKPIEKDGDPIPAERLRRRIAPVMLRRSKDIVATELPKKTVTLVSVEMGKHQRELYESIRVAMDDRLRDAIAAKGLAKSSLVLLEALLRLRQVCCDPSLIDTEAAQAVKESAKLERLSEMLPVLVEEGRRILIFSQFTGMLQKIADQCDALKLPYVTLTGQTRKRQEVIDAFQKGEFPIFLISLKAGGTGLTLTEADTVIHYDPWWNPAAEDQATDRAHRIGQDKPVFVYRFIAAGSVEERINQMQERKRSLASSLYGNDGQVSSRLDEKDIEELFRPLG